MNKKPIFIKKRQNVYKVYFQSSEKMDQVKDKSVQLIFTSPPYYNLKEYKSLPKKQVGQIPHSPKDFDQSYEAYLEQMRLTIEECSRVIKDTGVIVCNLDVIKFKTKDKNIIPLPFDFMNLFKEFNIGCKDILIYKKLTGVPFQFGKKLKNRHEYLLILSKSNNYKWNLDAIREPYEKDYIYPPNHYRRNKIGKAPSSVWEYHPPFQTGNHHYHYCPFPDGMVDRAIKLFTNKNDIVLDPFLGSGKVVARAKALNRKGIGYEINPKFRGTIKKMIMSVK